MAMSISLILAASLLVSFSCCSKLNVPRVLLSYSYDVPSNFTLRVIEGGCYHWRSTRGNDVHVLPVFTEDGCATEAVVSAVTRSAARQTAIILAADVATGEILRCDVIIDSFSRLEIITTTRELYVEEAPEEFEVRAYDDQGNEFSSLDGLKFNWVLENVAGQQGAVPAHSILRFMRFSESPYKTPETIGALEQLGHQGSQVLVEGRQTGVARLKASIAHPAYQALQPAVVTLMVVANLLLEPQDVYVLPDTAVVYAVYHLKQGMLLPVPLKTSHYYLQVSDPLIGELHGDGISVVSQQVGQTKVVLEDSNVKASGNIKQPSANFHVVQPGYLVIEIEPGNKPSLIIGKPSAFHVHLHDEKNNRIFLSDSIVIKTNVPTEYFSNEEVRPNGTFVAGLPVKEGKMTVTAMLDQYSLRQEIVAISPPIKASLDVMIYAALTVSPKYTLLPWDEVTRPQHSLQLAIKGGSGHVLWHTNAPDVATVSKTGLVSTHALGEALLAASMFENSANRDSAVVVVREVMGLNLVEGYREFLINESLVIGIAAFTLLQDEAGVFSSCEMLTYKMSDFNPDFSALAKVRPKELNGSCASLDVIAQRPGFSGVKVSFLSSGSQHLAASTTIGSFKPLTVVKPESGKLVLALGTGYFIHFEGGPLPWIHKPSGHFTYLDVADADLLRSHLDMSGRSVGSYKIYVECLQLGETKVTLTVGNKASSTLPYPRESTASSSILCASPEIVQLGVVGAEALPCPLHQHGSAVASCQSLVPVSVTVRDAHDNRLDNISSLVFSWSTEQPHLVTFNDDGALVTDASGVVYGTLVPRGLEGELTISVVLLKEGISASLRLRLVTPPALLPKHLVLHHHPGSSGYLRVTKGSGYFELLPDDTNGIARSSTSNLDLSKRPDAVATLFYHSTNSSIVALAKGVGSRLVTVRDLCLYEQSDAPSAVVTVAVPSAVTLIVPAMVEQGNSVEAVLQLISNEGFIVPILPNVMQFSVVAKEDLVSLEYLRLSQQGGAVYKVTGITLGDTSLRGTINNIEVNGGSGANNRSNRLVSPYEPVKIFLPLRLRPRHVTLIVGAEYQVRASGGPASTKLLYQSSNTSVCEVNADSGVVSAAMIGTTTISVTAKLSSSSTSSEHLLPCADVVYVRVVPVSAIEIVAPTSHLESGSSMPLYVTALAVNASHNISDDDVPSLMKLTPLNFASAEPPLLFRWSNTDSAVATLDHVLAANGVESRNVNTAALVIRAAKPGVTTVSVEVSVLHAASSPSTAQIIDDSTLTATFTLTVFEPLSLTSPSANRTKLLMSPGSVYALKSNRDDDRVVKFTSTSECLSKNQENPSSEAQQLNYSSHGPTISLHDNVVHASNTTGIATVMVSAQETPDVVQHASVLVEVRDVCYVLVSALPVLNSVHGKVAYVALGSVLPLRISYHDCTGREFDAISHHNLAVVSNREDLVVHNRSHHDALELQVRGAGQTVLAVTLRTARANALQHFFRIPSASALIPHQACVSVGQPVCLKSAVRGAAGDVGRWAGGEGVAVLPAEGVALSLLQGAASVVLSLVSAAPQQHLKGQFTVTPIKQLTLLKPTDVLSDGFVDDMITIDVALSGDCEANTAAGGCWPDTLPSSALLQHLSCELQVPASPGTRPSDVFLAHASYIPGRGYACIVQTATAPAPWLRKLYASRSDVSVSLVVALSAISADQPPLKSAALLLPFVPGVSLNGSGSVALSASAPSDDSVVVVGPQEALALLVIESDIRTLSARLSEPVVGSQGGSERRLTIQATGGHGEEEVQASVNITSPLTRQTLQVRVLLESSLEGACGAPQEMHLLITLLTTHQTQLFAVLAVVLTAAAGAVGYQAWSGPGYRSTNAAVFANSPVLPPSPLAAASPYPRNASPHHFNVSPHRFNINLWSTDPVYGAPSSPPSLRRSRSPLSPT